MVKGTCEQILEQEFYNNDLQKCGNWIPPKEYGSGSYTQYNRETKDNMKKANNYLQQFYFNNGFESNDFVYRDSKEDPIWGIIYILLRAGQYESILDLLRNYDDKRDMDVKSFATYFEYYYSREIKGVSEREKNGYKTRDNLNMQWKC